MSVKPSLSDLNLIYLPFDQYGRYRMIQEALGAVRPVIAEQLRILDVGGFFRTGRGQEILPARQFLPQDDVTVVDQQPCGLAGFVYGDGRKLPFPDKAFDFVISCDTLEHVPAPDRPAFWQELLRVARYGVLLAAPFASLDVVAAEDLLFAYIKAELGVEQPQLQEHRAYGLPDRATTGALLDTIGLRYYCYPSGYVHAWLTMMLAKHSRLFGTPDLQERLDAYYTRCFGPEERREPAYRHLFVVEQDRQGDWLAAVDAAMRPTIGVAGSSTAGWSDMAGWVGQILWYHLDERRSQTVLAQIDHIAELQHRVSSYEMQVQDLEQRARWLDEQATAVRQELAAVQQGRLMRVLGWLHSVRGH